MLCFALVFAVPQAIFRETYSWSAGFWNYVPPAVSLLAIAAADSKIIIGKGKIKPAAVLLLCILTLCGQLYMEHCTIAAVLFSLGALIIYIIKYKKLSLTLLFQTVLAVTGAVIMFSSPIYGNVADGSDTYRTMEFSLDKLLGTAMINFNVISRYGIKESVAIYIVAAALLTLLILKNKSKHRALNIAVITANAIMPVYFLLSRYISPQFFPVSHFKFAFYFDIFAIAFYAALLSFSVCIYVRDSLIKTQILVLICLALLMCGPLLAVTPIGPRCFYAIYILLAAVVIQLLSYCITVCGLKPQKLNAPAAIVFCAVILFYGYIAADMHKLETQKIDYIESQMTQGASEITLPKFKFGDYLHDPDSGKIKYEYKYSYPGDIEFEYLPYDEWLKIKK